MADFTAENKEVKEMGDYNGLPYGVSKVFIGDVVLDTTKDGKEYMELTVFDDQEREDKARVWFHTDAAINYSFNALRQIFVHIAPEDKKDAARDMMDNLPGSQAMFEAFQEKAINGQCWFTKYPDPERTYQDSQGVTRPSINKNIMGYEPKQRDDLMPKPESSGDANVDKVFGGGTNETKKQSAAGTVPGSWDS